MSERSRNIGKIIRPMAEIGAAGVAAAFVGIAGITARHHRQLTHRSLELHPILEKVIDTVMKHYGDPAGWAGVHRIHHEFADATAKPFLEIKEPVRWMQANPSLAEGVATPQSYMFLDPFVKSFSLEDVLEIGDIADRRIREYLPSYEPPSFYTKEELQALLNPTGPRYFYSEGPKHPGSYTQDEIAEIVLGDPHSPVRIPPPEQNGVRGVLKSNVTLYRRAADLFKYRRDLIPKDLQKDSRDPKDKFGFADMAKTALVLAPLVLLARHKYKPADFAKAVLAGEAIYWISVGVHLLGGNITNSLGHAGVMTPEGLLKGPISKDYKPIINPDGTVSTNSVNGGPIGRLISLLTLDEVGGQSAHHDGPEKIAFTFRSGINAWIDAPWGRFLSFLANSKYFPLMSVGPGFELKEGQVRPDDPSPALAIIHRRRVEQMEVLQAA